MKKQLSLALLALTVGVSAYARYNNNEAQYKKVDMRENALQQHANNIENAIQTFAQGQGLKKQQHAMVARAEKMVKKHSDDIDATIAHCAKWGLFCSKVSKIDGKMNQLDIAVNNFTEKVNNFVSQHGDSNLKNIVNKEMSAFNTAAMNFKREVNIYVNSTNQCPTCSQIESGACPKGNCYMMQKDSCPSCPKMKKGECPMMKKGTCSSCPKMKKGECPKMKKGTCSSCPKMKKGECPMMQQAK